MKIANRFYVASQSMNPKSPNFREWAKPTLEEAIAHATELAQETEKERSSAYTASKTNRASNGRSQDYPRS